MLRVVVDTNIWIRTLLGGQVIIGILVAFRQNKFKLIFSEALIEELRTVANHPRLYKYINPVDLTELLELIEWRGERVELATIPPRCRDPKDHPVLATAIDGRADAIVTGDDDLRSDDDLRNAMAGYSVQLWGIQTLFNALE